MKPAVTLSAKVLSCALLLLIIGTDRAVGQSEFNDLAELADRANLLLTAGRGRAALPLADRLVAHAGEVFSDHAQNLSFSFEVAGLIYWDQGLYAKAEPLFKRVIAIRENALGREHADVALAISNLASLYLEQGRYAESEKLNKRALAIRENTLGNDHLDVAKSLNNLGNLYWTQGRFAEAEQIYRRALGIREKGLGKKHPDVATSLNNLANLLKDQGRYAEAEPMYQQAKAIWEEAFGKEHPIVGQCFNNLAALYFEEGRYADAEQFFLRSLAIKEKAFGKEHPEVAKGLMNLGNVYSTQSRYADADPLYQRALAIQEKTLGKSHPDVAATLDNLFNLNARQGRYTESLALGRQALAIREKSFGPEHQLVANSLHGMAVILYYQGQYAEAKPLYQRALAIWEKVLGKEHPDTAYAVDNLARLASAQGQFAEAEQLFQRALAIREKVFGKNHHDVADTLHNLADSYLKQDQFAKAEPLVDRAIAIWDVADVGALDRFRGYDQRARLRWRIKKTDLALADLNHALDLVEQVRGQASGGETRRAEFFSSFADSYETMVTWQQQLGNINEVLTTIERSRARSLVDQLATANIDLLAGVPAEEAAALRTRQSKAQQFLAQLEKQAELIAADKNLSNAEREQKSKELDEKLHAAREEVVNSYLAIRNASPVYRQMVGKDFKPSNLADIQSRLAGDDGLLLEYFLGDDAGYLVMIPAVGGKARVESLMLSKEQGTSLGIEPGPLTGTRMRAILSNDAGSGLLQQLRDASKAEATTDRLAVLWNVLVPEAERKLLVEGKLKRLIVIPDAALAAFPFDTLVVEPGEKPKYLLDVGPPIVTAPSATLLMNLAQPATGDGAAIPRSLKGNKLLSVADPTYGVPSTNSAPTIVERSARSRYAALRGDLRPLPFTAWECNWVAETFRKAGLDAGILQKANAREASVRMYAPGRKYLHFACHGLVDQSYGNLFGALALTPGPAGSADPMDDGFLTLAEIYELNLQGAELSILSACDTNFGPNQKGEGTWSLSRGFLVAGSKRVVASNWLVDDEAGASLISVFCSELVKEKPDEPLDYAARLQAAKRWVRNQEKWKNPYYWGTFVLVGPS